MKPTKPTKLTIDARKAFVLIMAIACSTALAFALCACGGSTSESSDSASSGQSSSAQDATGDADADVSYKTSAEGAYASGTHHAKVTVKGFEPFTIELDADSAPVTVSNFCELAESGFYSGCPFHRIVEDFCLQGGDPTGTGTGGSDTEIVGEFSSNGVDNPLADDFKKGTVAMARSSLPNSASSQFFITLDSSEGVSLSLNGQYAAFGTVDKAGMKIVDKIVEKYLPKADAAASGTIADKADMPIIKKVEIVD